MHKALYRIHRPRQFADIVGQDTIVQILQNQISEDSLSHAYLFSGSRGTGKTSTAKVFSRAVNCSSRQGAEPCGTCLSCREGEVDIIEIDAASNNSVDNIREIRENVIYAPAYGKYKIYIIDEVHMLSQGAFNALLKTLEEPPPHIIFILATTEPQKIPQTVLSRVQRYDFRRIDPESALLRLRKILDEMSVSYEEAALEFIIRKSEGSLRDALGLLDKAMAHGKLTYEAVLSAMGETEYAKIAELMTMIREKNAPGLLGNLQKISEEGQDIKHLVSACIEYLREVLLMKYGVVSSITREEKEIEEIEKSADFLSISDCIALMEGFSQLEADIKYAAAPQVLVEAFFLRSLYRRGEEGSWQASDSGQQEEIGKLEQKIRVLEEKNRRKEEGLSEVKERREPVEGQESKRSLPSYFEPEPMKIELSEQEKSILEEIKHKMEEVYISLQRKKYVNIKALLQNAEPVRYLKDCLYFAYDEGYLMLKKMVDTEENKRVLRQTLAEIFGKEIGVFFIMKKEASSLAEASEDELLEELRSAFDDLPIQVYKDAQEYETALRKEKEKKEKLPDPEVD